MKLFFLLFISLFLLASPVFAKSGCCSSHGGVNCGAGAQGNGNVICNDGWTGSTCAYSEMVMCGGSSNSQSAPIQQTQPVYIPPTNIPYVPPTNTPGPTRSSSPTKQPSPTRKISQKIIKKAVKKL